MTTPLTEAREAEIRARAEKVPEVERDGNTLYVLNESGTNLWAAGVQSVEIDSQSRCEVAASLQHCAADRRDLLTALDSERAKVAELVKALEKSRWLLQTLCDEGRIDYCHADDCPEDDTCSCPLPVAINDAGRQWDAALSRARRA